MYVQYGNYRHASGECALQPLRRQSLFNDGGIVYAFEETWQLKGFLQAADPGSITAAINALQAAYAVPYQTLGLYNDDGTPSAHGIYDAATITGVRPMAIEYPQSTGADYSTFREWVITLSWEVHNPRVGLLAWTESVHYSGGGTVFVFQEPLRGLPQKQTLKENTVFRATQRGSAIGHFSYPVAPGPLWPADMDKSPDVDYAGPKRRGKGFTDFKTDWSYSFAAVLPLIGFPHLWPNN